MTPTSPTLGDVIRRFDAPLHSARGELMTPAQDAVLSALGRCRTAALGGHLYHCDHCAAQWPVYNPCRSRLCPSCLGHKSAQWLEARAADLLPVPYFHVVFTVPKQIAALALGNKKLLYGILFRAASQTLLQLAADPKHLGASIGFLAILHTWTQTLLHHPHLHCVVPGGGLSPDGDRWVGCRDGFFLPVKVLSSLFRGKFLALLDDAARRGELRLAGSTAALSSPRAWSALLASMRSKPWVVYAKPPFGSPKLVLKYLARYTHKVAISNPRIVALTDTHVSFRYRNRKRETTRIMTLAGTEFLRRFLLHILPKGFVRIRHFGLMANRVRRDRLAQCRTLLGVQVPAIHPSAVVQHDDATDDVIESDPRRCPRCHVGHLRPLRTLIPTIGHRPRLPRAPPDTS